MRTALILLLSDPNHEAEPHDAECTVERQSSSLDQLGMMRLFPTSY
jgi:hypothetical protein